MKNKKGFTTVELVVSFALVMSIIIILFQIIISLKNLYENSGIKTQLLNKQALIMNQLETSLSKKELTSITGCGDNCFTFTYNDGTNEQLNIDKTNGSITLGNWKIFLTENSYFGSILIDSYTTPVYNNLHDDSFIIIDIPIYHDNFKDKNYGIHFIYQYNSNVNNVVITGIS